MALCAKCHRAAPSTGDTWCLGCSGWEALGSELSFTWGHPGLRAIATDIVVSAVRQGRALRVTKVLGPQPQAARPQGRAPAAEPPSLLAGGNREPGGERAPLPRSPRAEAAPAEEDKKNKEAADESSYEQEDEESEAVSDATVVKHPSQVITKQGLSAKAAPPARRSADRHEEVKAEEEAAEEPLAGKGTELEAVEGASSARGSRDVDRDRHRHRREPGHHRGSKRKRKRDRTHRAGRKHKRLHRAEANPYLLRRTPFSPKRLANIAVPF